MGLSLAGTHAHIPGVRCRFGIADAPLYVCVRASVLQLHPTDMEVVTTTISTLAYLAELTNDRIRNALSLREYIMVVNQTVLASLALEDVVCAGLAILSALAKGNKKVRLSADAGSAVYAAWRHLGCDHGGTTAHRALSSPIEER
jgi:hypothetical protein